MDCPRTPKSPAKGAQNHRRALKRTLLVYDETVSGETGGIGGFVWFYDVLLLKSYFCADFGLLCKNPRLQKPILSKHPAVFQIPLYTRRAQCTCLALPC